VTSDADYTDAGANDRPWSTSMNWEIKTQPPPDDETSEHRYCGRASVSRRRDLDEAPGH